MQKGWDDVQIPMIVKPGRYDAVANDIETALREAGLDVTRKRAPRSLEVPPRLLGRSAAGPPMPSSPTSWSSSTPMSST